MKINCIKKGPLEYVLIDDFYSKDEISLIKKNIKNLIPELIEPDERVGVSYENGKVRKNCLSIFLDDYYELNRESSDILKINRKIFSDEIYEEIENLNAYFGCLKRSSKDTTLLNVYRESEEYLPHNDSSLLTILTTFSFGKFDGGEFSFPDYDEEIPFKENQVIMFAGCIKHQAKPFKKITKNAERISIAQFINYK